MSEHLHFKLVNGQCAPAEPLTNEELRSLSEQRAKMFTSDRQFRMVVEMREKYRNGQLKLRLPLPSQGESRSTSTLGAKD